MVFFALFTMAMALMVQKDKFKDEEDDEESDIEDTIANSKVFSDEEGDESEDDAEYLSEENLTKNDLHDVQKSTAEDALLHQLQGLDSNKQKLILAAFRILQSDLVSIQPPVANRILIKNLVLFFFGYQIADQVAQKMRWLRSTPYSIESESQLLELLETHRSRLLKLK